MREARRRVARRITGAVATAVALLGTVSATSRASDQHVSGHAIHWNLHFRDTVVDIGAPGFSVGDPIVLDDAVVDANGRTVGVQAGTCTITALLAGNHFRTYCTGAIRFVRGQIAFAGTVTDAPDKTLAVTGGTGRYYGASGQLTVVELGHDDAGTLTVHLGHGQH